MKKDKDQARCDYIETIKNSWTFARLTAIEQKQITSVLEVVKIFGSYIQRCEILNSVYFSFLICLGYQPDGWRETKEEAETMPRF
jgi:hypothetical protein